jgi:hypothetical protein
MDLKQDLPKIGQVTGENLHYEVDGESIYIGRRPDYADFKNKPYQDEETCVSVLLGISKPNALLLYFERRMDSLSIKDKENDPSYGLYRQLVDLFQSIRNAIDIGIATKEIGKVPETEETELQFMRKLHTPAYGPEYRVEHCLNCKFSCNRFFNTLYFLSWMQENRYPIPEEIAFEKSDNGDLVWIDRQIENQRTVKLSKETPSLPLHSTNPDERLEEILTLFKPDIEHFYKYLKRTLQKYKFESPDYPAIAEEAFDNAIAKKTFNYLSKNNFGKIFQTETLPTPNVRIKGYLAANMILSLNDDILLGIKDVLNGQNLLTKMNKLEKNA